MIHDMYKAKSNEIFRLYLAGYEAGDISGRTGVPVCRIHRELDAMTQRDPGLMSRHLAAKYPSHRKANRWPKATFVITKMEQHVSVNEY